MQFFFISQSTFLLEPFPWPESEHSTLPWAEPHADCDPKFPGNFMLGGGPLTHFLLTSPDCVLALLLHLNLLSFKITIIVIYKYDQ